MKAFIVLLFATTCSLIAKAELDLGQITMPEAIVTCSCGSFANETHTHVFQGERLTISIYTPIMTPEKVSFEKQEPVYIDFIDYNASSSRREELRAQCIEEYEKNPLCNKQQLEQ